MSEAYIISFFWFLFKTVMDELFVNLDIQKITDKCCGSDKHTFGLIFTYLIFIMFVIFEYLNNSSSPSTLLCVFLCVCMYVCLCEYVYVLKCVSKSLTEWAQNMYLHHLLYPPTLQKILFGWIVNLFSEVRLF